MLTVGLLVCAMMALATADDEAAAPACPPGWTEINSRCFTYVPRKLSWANAETNCLAMEGHLASVLSVSDDEALQALIRAATQSNPDTWVGASNCQQEKSWFWSDGADFSFKFFCPAEPNNAGGKEHCLQMNFGGQTCWNDADCSLLLGSICAKNK